MVAECCHSAAYTAALDFLKRVLVPVVGELPF